MKHGSESKTDDEVLKEWRGYCAGLGNARQVRGVLEKEQARVAAAPAGEVARVARLGISAAREELIRRGEEP